MPKPMIQAESCLLGNCVNMSHLPRQFAQCWTNFLSFNVAFRGILYVSNNKLPFIITVMVVL